MDIREVDFEEFLEKVKLIQNPAICAKNIGWTDVDGIRRDNGYVFFDWGNNSSWIIEETGLPVATINDEVYFLQGQFNKDNITKIGTDLISVESMIPVYSEFYEAVMSDDGEEFCGKSYLVMNLNLYGLLICNKTTTYLDYKDELINCINLYFLEQRLDKIDEFLSSDKVVDASDDDVREKMNTLRRILEKLLKIYLFYKSDELSYSEYDKVEKLSVNTVTELKRLVKLDANEKDALSKVERYIHRFSHDEPVINSLLVAKEVVTYFRSFYELLRKRIENDPSNIEALRKAILG